MRLPALFFVLMMSSTSVIAHELTLTVDAIKNVKGHMVIALYHNVESYKTDQNMLASRKEKITDNTLTIDFGDLPEGYYAIKLYQDANDNGKIDKNLIGIPTEGYGFSNNGGSFGQPSFDEAKFLLDKTTEIKIHLK